MKHGFSFIGPGTVWTQRFSWEAEQILPGPNGLTLIRLADGNDLWLPPINSLRLGDGDIHFNPAGAVGQVIRLYQAVLDRPPDLEGLLFHVGRIEAGFGIVDVAASFLWSPEFQTRFGGLTNEQLVSALYQVALGRAPDPEGFAFHLGQLEAGMPREEKIAQFVASPEAAGIFGNRHPGGVFVPNPHAARIAAAYDAVFDRPRSCRPCLLVGASSRAGTPPTAISSPPSRSRRNSRRATPARRIVQFVTSIYASALERAPDAGGGWLIGWGSWRPEHSTVSTSSCRSAFPRRR